jgi:5-formyltetrahydrofolate cyclo-ligase
MSDTPASSLKASLRAAALAARDALSVAQRIAGAQAIAVRGLPFDIKHGIVAAGYSPIRSEIDPAPLMRKLAARGVQLALPVITARDSALQFRAWSPDDRLWRRPL